MKNIDPIKRPVPLNQIAYKRIKKSIINADFQFDTLYSEQNIADLLEISRTPVREALLRLDADGLIDIVKNRGFRLRTFSEKALFDFFETREMIERYTIEHIIQKLNQSDFKKIFLLQKNMEGSKEDLSDEAFISIDRDFHFYLIAKLNNRMINSIFQNIRDLVSLYGTLAITVDERREDVKAEHNEIVKSLVKKDAESAVKAVKNHLYFTRKSILKVL